jgi:hypothetical protein
MASLTPTSIQAFFDRCDGYGNGIGYGFGDGNGYGNGIGNGDGYGYGFGFGDGFGDGYGDGYGFGDGFGDGYGDGYGNGYGNGNGIKQINGLDVNIIDNIPTVLTEIHGNVAKGFVLEHNVILRPCFVVREGDEFAHGDTLHDAYRSLQEKRYDNSTTDERIEAFRNKFPEYDTAYSNTDLFTYHHVLTGSCRMGRESFCKSRGIDMNGKTTVRQFIELVKDTYGADIIRLLPQAYGITD